MRVVCTTGYFPLTACSSDTDVSGYEIEVFKRVATELALTGSPEWAPGNWTWKCIPAWDQALNEVMKAEGPRACDLMVGGVSATPARILAGVRFTHPTLESGRRIMVHINKDRGTWSFLEPFEASLWLAVFGTSAFVGLVLLLSETRWQALLSVPGPTAQRAMGLQWGALTVLLRMASQLSPRTTAGRLILAGWGFMALVLANLYVSAMAAILATRSQQVDIQGMDDLVDEPVGAFQDDQSSFQKFALQDARYLPWSTDEDEANMLRLLRSGAVKALVLDSPWVRYTAAANCDLFIVGDMVLPVNLAFAFPNEVPESYLHIFDSALTFLDDTGVLTQLQRQLLQPPKPCHSPQGGLKDVLSPVVELDDVAGLWIMLAVCIGAAVLWNVTKLLWTWLVDRQQPPLPQTHQAHQAQASQPFHRASASNGSLHSQGGKNGQGAHGGAAAGGGGSRGLTASGVALDADLDPSALLGNCPTHDEALKAMEHQLSKMDHLIQHMPFVMAAVMDARLDELRGQLVSLLMAQHAQHAGGGAGANGAVYVNATIAGSGGFGCLNAAGGSGGSGGHAAGAGGGGNGNAEVAARLSRQHTGSSAGQAQRAPTAPYLLPPPNLPAAFGRASGGTDGPGPRSRTQRRRPGRSCP